MKFRDLVDLAGYLTHGDFEKAMELEIAIVAEFQKDGPMLVKARPGMLRNMKTEDMVLTIIPENIAVAEIERSQKAGDGFYIPDGPNNVN